MRSAVEGVIYFYLFICAMLLIFNILYITRSKRVKLRRADRVCQWEKIFSKRGVELALSDKEVENLKRIENLMAFHAVLSEKILNTPKAEMFFRSNAKPFQMLALEYQKKSAMERAFFSYVIASFHTSAVGNNDMLAEILLQYLDNSTVYSRENVLQALYVLGRPNALEHAFEILNQRGWYHNPKLIADGMVKFTGDKEELALRLWKHRETWEEPLNVGVVQYAAALSSSKIDEAFYSALREETLTMEVQFALIRYFQRHYYVPAKALLHDFLEIHHKEESQLAVAAAAALQTYPDEATKQILKDALRSRNWYVRRNAAMSLTHMGISEKDLQEIENSGDRYALEMLEYAAERNAAQKQIVKGEGA